MLEVLYASRLRSELTTLTVAQFSHDMGVVRILGRAARRGWCRWARALDWVQRLVGAALLPMEGRATRCSLRADKP
jgi:site-specific recombinase XerD